MCWKSHFPPFYWNITIAALISKNLLQVTKSLTPFLRTLIWVKFGPVNIYFCSSALIQHKGSHDSTDSISTVSNQCKIAQILWFALLLSKNWIAYVTNSRKSGQIYKYPDSIIIICQNLLSFRKPLPLYLSLVLLYLANRNDFCSFIHWFQVCNFWYWSE